jgi:hypothetical protein
MSAETTPRKQRGRPWPRGVSGNPAGRPKGARHKATLTAEALLDGESERLTRKAVELALAGDTTALRLCLERVVPPRKERPIALTLPDGADLVDVTSALLAVVAAGELTPGEAGEMGKLVEAHRKAVEAGQLEARIAALEALPDPILIARKAHADVVAACAAELPGVQLRGVAGSAAPHRRAGRDGRRGGAGGRGRAGVAGR